MRCPKLFPCEAHTGTRMNGQYLTMLAYPDASDDHNETGHTYLSSSEFVRPNRPGPEVREYWHIAKAPASHGMRVDRSSNVDMSVKILYSTTGLIAGLVAVEDSEGELEAIACLVT